MQRAVVGGIFVAPVAAAIWVVGGWAALAYLAVFGLATLPGLPVGFRLFGRRHAAGWIAAMLFGYWLTALACWAVVFTGYASNTAFVIAWAASTIALWAAAGSTQVFMSRPLVALPRWTNRDTIALVIVLQLVPVLTGPVLARVGTQDAEGNRLYAAYFTADFVWHTALVAEMSKHTQPPRNPYLASQPIHYYWTYFLVPSAASALSGADIEVSLKTNAIATALLFVAATYLAAWTALPAHAFTIAAALFLTVVASSAEGLAAIAYVAWNGQSLGALRDLNVDALSRGLGGLRIDNLPRAMWYTPHHSMAYAIGLVAFVIAVGGRGVRVPSRAILLAGLALAASFTLNPLVGAIFCALYGLVVLTTAVVTRTDISEVLRHALAVLPVLLAVAWSALNHVADGAASAVRFGLHGPAANAPVLSFLLSCGPILILVAFGLWPQQQIPFSAVAPAFIGALLCVLIMHLVVLTVDQFWIGFRTGHLFFVFVPALVARGLLFLAGRGRRLGLVGAACVFLIGAPTTTIDAYNAQNVENDRMGPGFHWTVKLTPAVQEGLMWVRTHTPPKAVVQADPTVRGRDTWSLIPTWGERSMAGGQPISLMHVPEYDETTKQVKEMYATPEAVLAWQIAKQLRIDFVYVDATERAAYPNVAKFDADGEHFAAVFRNSEVVVYAVR